MQADEALAASTGNVFEADPEQHGWVYGMEPITGLTLYVSCPGHQQPPGVHALIQQCARLAEGNPRGMTGVLGCMLHAVARVHALTGPLNQRLWLRPAGSEGLPVRAPGEADRHLLPRPLGGPQRQQHGCWHVGALLLGAQPLPATGCRCRSVPLGPPGAHLSPLSDCPQRCSADMAYSVRQHLACMPATQPHTHVHN